MASKYIKSELKSLFTAHWEYLAVNAACKIDLFDLIDQGYRSLDLLQQKMNSKGKGLYHLVQFLLEQEYLIGDCKRLALGARGSYLTEGHSESLKQMCLLWAAEHMDAWQHLSYSLKTGEAAISHLYGKGYFDYLNDHPEKLANYQQAMFEYARDDYRDLYLHWDFSAYEVITDLGGGTGALLKALMPAFPEKRFRLCDLPEVLQLREQQDSNLEMIAIDFFEPLPFTSDLIILSRILHDWPDWQAARIIQNCKSALNPGGHLMLIENANERVQAHLLSLNMLAICKSHERSTEEYISLLDEGGFELVANTEFNQLQNLIVFKCTTEI